MDFNVVNLKSRHAKAGAPVPQSRAGKGEKQ